MNWTIQLFFYLRWRELAARILHHQSYFSLFAFHFSFLTFRFSPLRWRELAARALITKATFHSSLFILRFSLFTSHS